MFAPGGARRQLSSGHLEIQYISGILNGGVDKGILMEVGIWCSDVSAAWFFLGNYTFFGVSINNKLNT